MRFSLTSLVRLVGFLALGFSALAVGLSRSVPEAPRVRLLTAPRYYGVNGSVFMPPSPRNDLIDAETGRAVSVELGPGDSLEYATSSPWTDGAGGYDIAGRLTSRGGEAQSVVCEGSSLARFGMPRRSLSGLATVGPVVAGRPCWVPGWPGRLLFPGGDGQLHVQDFADEGEPDAAGGFDAEPTTRRVVWGCLPPGDGLPLLGDPVFPTAPVLGGRVFVALRVPGLKGGRRGFGPSQIWWLTLNAKGTAITGAGRLTRPQAVGADASGVELAGEADERLPNLTVSPGGRVALAYLSREQGATAWSLRLAPVRVDAATRLPVAGLDEARTLAEDCAATTPPVSPDGRWVYAVGRTTGPVVKYPGFDIPEALEIPAALAHSPGRGTPRR